MKVSTLKEKYGLKDGDRIKYKGRYWTIQGNKIVRPLPADLVENPDKYTDHFVKNLSKHVNRTPEPE